MGLFGAVKSFFGGKKTTTTTGLDPASQKYVDAMRNQSLGFSNTAANGPAGGGSWFTGPQTMSVGDQAAAFFNPYQQNVVNAVQGQYDKLRAQAVNQGNMGLPGAFGGSRMALAQGARLGELDQGQAQTISGLLSNGYQNALQQGTAYAEQQRQLQQQQLQEPLFRAQVAQGLTTGGLGPVGQTTTQSSTGGGFGDLLKFGAGLATSYFGAKGMGGGGGGGGGGLEVGGQVPQQYMSTPNYAAPTLNFGMPGYGGYYR